MKIFSYFLIVILIHSISFAGWTSGGGEVLLDSKNPWFLSNTKEVRYCLQIDESHFGLTAQQVRFRISQAFTFWKNQFKDIATPVLENEKIELGTQQFIETACNDDTDLIFQMGVLTGRQMEYLVNSKKFIGISVRTEYDTKRLKGKGFIYFSPQSGPLKLEAKTYFSDFWSQGNGFLFLMAAIHELGHIFGVSHTDQIPLMGESFLEEFLKAAYLENKEEMLKMESYFLSTQFFRTDEYNTARLLCMTVSFPITEPIQDNSKMTKKNFYDENLPREVFFDLPEIKPDEKRCYSYQLANNIFTLSMNLKSDGPMEPVISGFLKMNPFYSSGSTAVIRLYMSEEQTAFPKFKKEKINKIDLVRIEDSVIYYGTVHNLINGVEREVFVTMRPGRIQRIGGILNGKLYLDLY